MKSVFFLRRNFRHNSKRVYIKGLFWITLVSILTIGFTSCARVPLKKGGAVLEAVPWSQVGSFTDDLGFYDLAKACKESLSYYQKFPASTFFTFGPERISAKQQAQSLRAFLDIVEAPELSTVDKILRIEQEFVLLRSRGDNGQGRVLFTGYYEPLLQGRSNSNEEFKYPLYKRPPDLVAIDLSRFPIAKSTSRVYGRLNGAELVPYYTREEIDEKSALAEKELELMWLKDPIDVFFLQIQGSVRVTLEDGREIRVQFDASNGQPYRSLGKAMLEKGLLSKEEVSLQSIRKYLQQHPDKCISLLSLNPSYIFFRKENSGPYGNIDVVLTPGRSIATDDKIFPKGALCLILTTKPVIKDGRIERWQPFSRFVLNQDTGSAIVGPGRVDLFWGQKQDAETAAGSMRQKGELYFLLRKKQVLSIT